METQTNNNPHAEILKDLENDFKSETTPVQVGAQPTVEVVPSFLPVPLVKLSVASKNGLIVVYLAKNLPAETKDVLKDHYKPTDEEINLYARFLEALLWKHFRSVAEWFMNNKSSTLLGEILLLESVRAAPYLTSVVVSKSKKEEKKNE